MKKTNGFTLVEVLVAMAILAIAMVALIQMFPQAMRMSRRAAEKTTVSSLAKTEMGRVKAAGVGDLIGPGNWAVRNGIVQLGATQNVYGAVLKADSLYKGWTATVQRTGAGAGAGSGAGSGAEVDLFRVTFSVELSNGRKEKFVTYVTRQ